MTEEPNNCPLCRSTNIEVYSGYVKCGDCELQTGVDKNTQEAINAWNKLTTIELSEFHHRLIEMAPDPNLEKYELFFDEKAKDGDECLTYYRLEWHEATRDATYSILRRPRTQWKVGDGFDDAGTLWVCTEVCEGYGIFRPFLDLKESLLCTRYFKDLAKYKHIPQIELLKLAVKRMEDNND